MQVDIKIVAFNPITDPGHFVADVYVDGNRVHCGTGPSGQTIFEAIKGACNDIVYGSDVSKLLHKKLEDEGYKPVEEGVRVVHKKV